jgi:hypothetical protein
VNIYLVDSKFVYFLSNVMIWNCVHSRSTGLGFCHGNDNYYCANMQNEHSGIGIHEISVEN